MSRILVAGSDNDPFFAIVDFTVPDHPVVKRIAPDPTVPFGACRVAINESRIAVGDGQGSDIRLLDVADPSNPLTLGFLKTNLLGVGALAIRGSLLAAGEFASADSARLILVDWSSPAQPVILATVLTPFASTDKANPPVVPQDSLTAAITSVVFASDTVVLVAGGSEPEILQIDFRDSANPVLTNLSKTILSGSPAIDFASGKIAAGDGNGSHVNLFNLADFSLISSFTSKLFPVTSVALSESFILAGSSEDQIVSCIPLDGSPVQIVQANLGLGLITAISGTIGACGGLDSPFVVLIDLEANPAALLGVPADVQFETITSIGLSTFTTAGSGVPGAGGGSTGQPGQGPGSGGVIPPPPHFSVRPLSLRRSMLSKHLNPAAGLRAIRPFVTSVAEFIIFP